ncbi:Auxin-induced protein X10A-like protein [Drosera capensis]
MQDDHRRMKVKKGSLVVLVGLENDHDDDVNKFVIPISYIHHPLFSNLLDRARELYGYNTDGPLRLQCSADDFTDLRWRIEKELIPSLNFPVNSEQGRGTGDKTLKMTRNVFRGWYDVDSVTLKRTFSRLKRLMLMKRLFSCL